MKFLDKIYWNTGNANYPGIYIFGKLINKQVYSSDGVNWTKKEMPDSKYASTNKINVKNAT